ncbi:MAG TPA: demethoxyubiquinone hydroxylase family protein [Clostridia bacterium]|nr:demethoxyubiquinone hydroxylase family protein [Clostridia bacterium]
MAILGNPFVANVNRQLSPDELIQGIRVDIAGELEAIVGYEAHAMATDNENARKILFHIADEERHHIGELEQLLYQLSPKDTKFIEEGRKEFNQTLMS